MTYIAVALACALVLPLSAAPQAEAADVSAAAMTPFAMQIFCSERPAECRAAQNAVAEWTPRLAALLSETNARVNRDISPKADPKGTWEVSPAFGDCNDYALTKRSRLIRLGVPPGALRMAVTATRSGAPHAILVVKTSAGDVVLDNLSSDTKTLGQSGYSISMISTSNPLRWTRLR